MIDQDVGLTAVSVVRQIQRLRPTAAEIAVYCAVPAVSRQVNTALILTVAWEPDTHHPYQSGINHPRTGLYQPGLSGMVQREINPEEHFDHVISKIADVVRDNPLTLMPLMLMMQQ